MWCLIIQKMSQADVTVCIRQEQIFPFQTLQFPCTSLSPLSFVFPSAPKGKLDAIPHNRCLGSQVSSCTLKSLSEGSFRSDGVSSHCRWGKGECLQGPDCLSAAWEMMQTRKENHGHGKKSIYQTCASVLLLLLFSSFEFIWQLFCDLNFLFFLLAVKQCEVI